jgi:hypothetical protein
MDTTSLTIKKNTFDSSQDLNITINEDVFTSNNESQAQAEGNGLFEKIL